MKLFQQLLVAPAALGLLAPLAANAAEVNINDVASYSTPSAEVTTAQFSDVVPGDWAYTALQNLSESTGCVDNAYTETLKSGQSLTRYEAAALVNACLEGGLASVELGSEAARLSTEFGTEMAILKGRVDGLEYKVEELRAGAFSSATKMSGSAVFTTGFIDTAESQANINADTYDNHLATEYNFKLDLNTSFTGEDNLYAGLETGNQGDLAMDSAVRSLEGDNATETNEIQLASLYYTFPVGQFDVTAGPLLDQDDVISATTSIYSSAFRLGELPWSTAGQTGAGGAISYVNDNGWNGSFNIIAVEANDSTQGAFTLEGQDIYTVSVGYDAENFGGGAIYTANDNGVTSNEDTTLGLGVYFRPDGMPTISIAYDQLTDNDAVNSSNLTIGFDYPWGPGTVSAAIQSVDTNGTNTNNYEAYYNYPLNDSVSIQGGMFVEEVAGSDNTQGFVVETFFSF